MKMIICFLLWSAACGFAQAGVDRESGRPAAGVEFSAPPRLDVGRVPARLKVQDVILRQERERQKNSVLKDETETDSLVPVVRRHTRGLIC